MADPKYLVVYHEQHDGEPLALIRTDLDGNHATEMLRALRMLGGRVETGGSDTASFRKSADMAAMFDAGAAPSDPGATAVADEPDGTDDPDAQLRAEIRASLETEERRKRIETEVRAEIAAERGESDPGAPTNGGRDDLTELQATDDSAIPGVTMAQRDALAAAGFVTIADIRRATDKQLDAVDGIGPETVKKLREAMKA